MNNRLGNKIASLRKTNNLSQRELAKSLNVSNKTISKWECGNGKPDIEMIQMISDFFHISVDELLSESSQTTSIVQDNKKKLTNKMKITIISLVATVILTLAVVLSILYVPRSPIIKESEILKLDTEQSLLTTTVSNNTDRISLINSISVPITNEWKLYDEINCSKEITSKTVFLDYADNTFYILVENNIGKQKLYTVIIRRKPMYQVVFDLGQHYLLSDRYVSVEVEEDSLVEEPAFIPQKEGYYFTSWDFNFNTPITSNITIESLYLPNINILKFNGNESTHGEMLNINIKTNETINLPINNFEKDYYIFLGWSTSIDGDVEYYNNDYFQMNTNSEIILYAIWCPIQYDITYILNGGNLDTDLLSYNIEDTILLPSPSMSGANFDGWYTDIYFANSKLNEITKGSHGEIVLYAKWNYIDYSINYILNNGMNNPLNPSKYTIVDSNINLHDAEKEGYNFLGWYKSSYYSSYNKVTYIDTKICNNQTLYARWEPIKYNISYNLNGGKLEQEIKQYTIESEVLLYSPEKSGYEFLGWYNNPSYEGTAIDKISKGTIGDLQLYAKWGTVNYFISYELNEGENNTKNPSTYTIEDENIVLENPSRAGCDFLGWYTESTFTNKITLIETNLLKDMQLYAKWKILTYNITYELNGGTSNSLRKTYNVTNSFSLVAPTLDGAIFDGWYDSEEYVNKVDKIEKGTIGDLHFFAKWNYITYYVTYETNDGAIDGEYITEYTILDETIILPSVSRDGFRFLGWYTDIRCCENKISQINVNSCQNYTLYAKWIDNNHIGISTQEELKNIGGKDANNYYILLNDITISGSWYSISGFVSILDGNGYSIKNLHSYYLFGHIKGATVKNLNIENCNISITDTSYDSDTYGILAKKATNSTISNCNISGSLRVTKAHHWLSVGGFVGTLTSSTITDCTIDLTLYASTNGESVQLNAGGIVGESNDSNVINCSVECFMSLTSTGSIVVAGVVGGGSGGTCTNCTATGTINASGEYVTKGEIVPGQ